jgi:hypothetical protein
VGQAVAVRPSYRAVTDLILIVGGLGKKNRTDLAAEGGIHEPAVVEIGGFDLRAPLTIARSIGSI